MPIFQLRKLSKVKKGSYDQYLLTLPKAFGETLTSVGIDKILIALNKIGILIPVTDIKEAEKIKKRIYHRFSDIEKLIYEDPKPKTQFETKTGRFYK
ncbi:hypothetical protein IBX38_07220 [Candidatus Bathyarchaeota archaeon]|nr:hypothetical protein [Candidatus Bathyarchaeota archaeon]